MCRSVVLRSDRMSPQRLDKTIYSGANIGKENGQNCPFRSDMRRNSCRRTSRWSAFGASLPQNKTLVFRSSSHSRSAVHIWVMRLQNASYLWPSIIFMVGLRVILRSTCWSCGRVLGRIHDLKFSSGLCFILRFDAQYVARMSDMRPHSGPHTSICAIFCSFLVFLLLFSCLWVPLPIVLYKQKKLHKY